MKEHFIMTVFIASIWNDVLGVCVPNCSGVRLWGSHCQQHEQILTAFMVLPREEEK